MAVYSDLVPLMKEAMDLVSSTCKQTEDALLSNASSEDAKQRASDLAHASMALIACIDKYGDKPELLVESVATARKWYSDLYRVLLTRNENAEFADLKDAIEKMAKALKAAQRDMEAAVTDRERQIRSVFTRQADDCSAPFMVMHAAIAGAENPDLAKVLRQSAESIPGLIDEVIRHFSTTAGTPKHQVWTISSLEKVQADVIRVRRVALQRFDSILQSKERTVEDYSALAELLRIVQKAAANLLVVESGLAQILVGKLPVP